MVDQGAGTGVGKSPICGGTTSPAETSSANAATIFFFLKLPFRDVAFVFYCF